MYYRVAMRRQADQPDGPPSWQWKSMVLSSLQDLFQVLRLYEAVREQLDHLRVFSSCSREGLQELLVQENTGVGFPSVTATYFLQERRIPFPEGTQAAPEGEEGVSQPMASLAALSQPSAKESSRAGNGRDAMGRSALERRREERESGAGGDHDVAYTFVLPPSMPQVLAWVRLLARVHQEGFGPQA